MRHFLQKVDQRQWVKILCFLIQLYPSSIQNLSVGGVSRVGGSWVAVTPCWCVKRVGYLVTCVADTVLVGIGLLRVVDGRAVVECGWDHGGTAIQCTALTMFVLTCAGHFVGVG